MEYIMDFQGFRDENDFIVKELALISTDGRVCELELFLPPCDFHLLPRQTQKQVVWLEHHHRGLFWESGFKNYNELEDVFNGLMISGTVYVKGLEKQKLVKNMLSECDVKVVNLYDIRCPSLSTLKQQLHIDSLKPCVFNHDASTCAYINVHALLEWYKLEKSFNRRLVNINLAIKECFTKGYKDMNSDLIKYLPKEFILNHSEDVDLVYDKLSEELKSDDDVKGNLNCKEHISYIIGGHSDDIIIKRKNCNICKLKRTYTWEDFDW